MIFALSLLLDCRDQDDSDREITRDHSKSWVSSFLSMQVASISDNSPIPWIAAIFVLSRRLPKFLGSQNSPKITQTSLMSTSHPIFNRFQGLGNLVWTWILPKFPASSASLVATHGWDPSARAKNPHDSGSSQRWVPERVASGNLPSWSKLPRQVRPWVGGLSNPSIS